jgi:effector-binding domain-containing protein
MLETPRVVQSALRTTAFIHVTVPRSDIQPAYRAAITELTAALKDQGIPASGPRFSYFLQMPGELFDLQIGMQVDATVTATGRVSAGELPAMRVARTVYHGGMEGLGAAWGALRTWIAAQGYTPQPFIWENYLVGPDLAADASAWQTELSWPLAG